MGRYQIRTPEEKAIEDVLNEMATSAWDAVSEQVDLKNVTEEDFEKFYEKMKGVYQTVFIPNRQDVDARH